VSFYSRGQGVLEDHRYHELARLNAKIVKGRNLVDLQRAQVMACADQPISPEAVILLRELQRSVRLLNDHRRILMSALKRAPG
jgi:hypothetical protein